MKNVWSTVIPIAFVFAILMMVSHQNGRKNMISPSTSDWRRPLLEFLRNCSSISVLLVLIIVAANKIHPAWSFSVGGPICVFAMMLLVAIMAVCANISLFFDAVFQWATERYGISEQFHVIDATNPNSMSRIWAKLVFSWNARRRIFFFVVVMELVVLVGMTGSIFTAVRAAVSILTAAA